MDGRTAGPPDGQPGAPISALAGRRFFADRLSGQYAHHYHLIVSIFKGVALYSAAVAGLAILGSGASLTVKLAALSYWFASCGAIVATYDGIMVASIIVTAPPNLVDVVAPFVMGLAEYAQFAVLVPLADTASTADQLRHLSWWPLVFAILAMTATIDIRNSRTSIDSTLATAPPDLESLLLWYKGNLRESQILTGVNGVVVLGVCLLLRHGPEALLKWQAALGLLVLFGMVNGIVSQEKARQRIVASVAPRSPGRPAPAGEESPK